MYDMNADNITNKPITKIVTDTKGLQQRQEEALTTPANVTKTIEVEGGTLHPAPDTTENHGSQASVPMHNVTGSEGGDNAAPPPGSLID